MAQMAFLPVRLSLIAAAFAARLATPTRRTKPLNVLERVTNNILLEGWKDYQRPEFPSRERADPARPLRADEHQHAGSNITRSSKIPNGVGSMIRILRCRPSRSRASLLIAAVAIWRWPDDRERQLSGLWPSARSPWVSAARIATTAARRLRWSNSGRSV
jgi:hypothetical protein